MQSAGISPHTFLQYVTYMKILYISAAVLPSEKSHSLSIVRVCQALADSGHDVTLLATANPKNSSDPIVFYGLRGGFRIVAHKHNRILNSGISKLVLLSGFLLAGKNRKLIKKTRPDLIYSRLTISELAWIPSNIPIIYEMHSLGPLGQNILRRTVFKWILKHKNVRRIVVTTKVLAEMLRKYFPHLDIVVAKLSAELPVEISEKEKAVFKERHLRGWQFKFHVGYTGYMDTYGLRGTEIIIQTAARMPDVAFHLVGGEKEIVSYWCAYSKDYNLNSNIFFYGYRNPNEMPLFLSCFDVTLAPLQYRPSTRAPLGENMSPLKLPQYMSYGKAIVASDLPSHRECLLDKNTALLVSPDKVEEWVYAIQYLLQHDEKRKAMGNEARRAYYEGYTPKARVAQLLSGF